MNLSIEQLKKVVQSQLNRNPARFNKLNELAKNVGVTPAEYMFTQASVERDIQKTNEEYTILAVVQFLRHIPQWMVETAIETLKEEDKLRKENPNADEAQLSESLQQHIRERVLQWHEPDLYGDFRIEDLN